MVSKGYWRKLTCPDGGYQNLLKARPSSSNRYLVSYGYITVVGYFQ